MVLNLNPVHPLKSQLKYTRLGQNKILESQIGWAVMIANSEMFSWVLKFLYIYNMLVAYQVTKAIERQTYSLLHWSAATLLGSVA